jgi:methylated-DNA-protein-cysteine methyltransferase-like protein
MHPDYARIYAVIASIPRGKVATYGMVAALAGLPGRARQVGYALHALPPGSKVPWQRVINARGEISLAGESAERQRALLEKEGIELDGGRVSLARYTWRPGQVTSKQKPAAKKAAKRPAAKKIKPGTAAGRAPRRATRTTGRA